MFPYKLDYNSSSYLGLVYYIRNTTNHSFDVVPTASSIHASWNKSDRPYWVINGISETQPDDTTRWVSIESNYQWYQLEFKKFKIALTGYYMYTYRGRIRYMEMLGSNDGTNFDLIENTTVASHPDNYLAYVNISKLKWYRTFRLKNLGPGFDGNYAFDLYRIELFGYVDEFVKCSIYNCRLFTYPFIGNITPFILISTS